MATIQRTRTRRAASAGDTWRSRAAGFVRDVVGRFLGADGMTHTRALGYEFAFVVLSGFVGAVGLAAALDVEVLTGVALELGRTLSPDPAERLLGQAARQGTRGGELAALFGLGAALTAGTFAMAQVERSANRLRDSDADRPLLHRYAVALALAASVGLLLAIGALILGAGRAVPTGMGWRDEFTGTWAFIRWPLGLAVSTVAVLLLFRFAPAERIGDRRALASGAIVAVTSWAAFTGLLSVYFGLHGSSPYGPLLSIVALLLWSMLSSFALHVGLATACTLSNARRPARRTAR